MGIFPIIMNIVQFWLIDSIVKASATAMAAQDSAVPTHQDRDPLLSAPAVEQQPSPRPDPTSCRRSVSSLDSWDPEIHVVTTYQTIVTISDEQESSGASSSRTHVDPYAYRDLPPANPSSKSYTQIVQTSSPRFAAA